MAVTVVDSSNQIPFMGKQEAATSEVEKKETTDAKAEVESKVDVKADEPQVDEDGLTADERKVLGAKYDKIVAKRHRLQKEAEEARDEAEAFAENQYRERRAAERRAEELERQLQALKPAEKALEDAEPQETDEKYKDNTRAYWQDWSKWSARQELRAEREKEAQARVQAEQEASREALRKRIAETAKEIPDYEAVVSAADVQVPAHLAAFIQESEIGPKIGYHLAKHPEVLERLSKLSAIKAVAEIGKLEATLTTAPVEKPQPKTEVKPEAKPADKSRAPEPISTLSGNSAPVHKDLKDMTTRETIEYWAERDKAKASRRQRH